MFVSYLFRSNFFGAIGTTFYQVGRTIQLQKQLALEWAQRKDTPLQFLENEAESHVRIFVVQ